MKMGQYVFAVPYDAGAGHASQSANLRLPVKHAAIDRLAAVIDNHSHYNHVMDAPEGSIGRTFTRGLQYPKVRC
jgi:hypothetical protein